MAFSAKEEAELKLVAAKSEAFKLLQAKIEEKQAIVDAANDTRAQALAQADAQFDSQIAALEAAYNALQ